MPTISNTIAYNQAAATVVSVQPYGRYSFVDRVQVWLKKPITKSESVNLRNRCNSLHVKTKSAKFDRSYKQRLQLCQPSSAVLKELAEREHLVNQVEVALDWTFANYCHRDTAFETLRHYIVKQYHGGQDVRVVKRGKNGKLSRGSTWYSGQRWKTPTVLVVYAHRHCKITGEIHCTHTEWRMYGAAALRRACIFSLHDLAALDHREFWRKRLLLATLDTARLGRLWRRCGRQTAPRLSVKDGMIGGALIRACPHTSTQKVIDRYRLPRISRCLIRLPVDHLLPTARHEGIPYDYADKAP